MDIFQYGIHWDPREPLPEDYLHEETSYSPEVFPMVADSWPQVGANRYPDQNIYVHSLFAKTTQSPMPRSGPLVRQISNPTVPPMESVPYLAPLSLSVKGTIVQDRAAITVVQIFETPTLDNIHEARYSFPLPNDCTVTGFSCRFGADRLLKAKVTPREKAKQAFSQAVRDKRGAALLEQVTTEVFMASLGNLPANTRIKTEISYIVTLKTEFSADKTFYNFLMPTGIAPRYGERPLEVPNQNTEPGNVTLSLEILDAEHTEITCSSHSIVVQVHDQPQSALQLEDLASLGNPADRNVKHVKLGDEHKFNECDMFLSIQRESVPATPKCQAFGEKHSAYDNQMALMIDIPRSSLPLPHEPATYGEVIFLADRSGSMSDKMDALKSSLRFFLKGIPIGWSFNLWSFGTRYQYLWPLSRPYTAETLQEALKYLENRFGADLGGTELLAAVTALVETRSCFNKGPCEIIILTDGEVWRLDETLKYVDRVRNLSQGAIRFFALGIGSHVSAALVDGIARYGGGYSDIVRQSADQPWEDRVVKMLNAATSTRHDYSLSLQLGDGFQIQHQWPRQLGVINTPFQSSKVFLLVSQDQTAATPLEIALEFRDQSNNRSCHLVTIPISWKNSENDMIHALAARACISELDLAPDTSFHPEATVYSSTRDDMATSTKKKSTVAEAMACRYSLLSKWTSLFLEYERPHDTSSGLLTSTYNASESTQRFANLYQARGPRLAHASVGRARKRGRKDIRCGSPSNPQNPCIKRHKGRNEPNTVSLRLSASLKDDDEDSVSHSLPQYMASEPSCLPPRNPHQELSTVEANQVKEHPILASPWEPTTPLHLSTSADSDNSRSEFFELHARLASASDQPVIHEWSYEMPDAFVQEAPYTHYPPVPDLASIQPLTQTQTAAQPVSYTQDAFQAASLEESYIPYFPGMFSPITDVGQFPASQNQGFASLSSLDASDDPFTGNFTFSGPVGMQMETLTDFSPYKGFEDIHVSTSGDAQLSFSVAATDARAEPMQTFKQEAEEIIPPIDFDHGMWASSNAEIDDRQDSHGISKDHRSVIIDILENQKFDGSMDDSVINVLGRAAEKAIKELEALLLDRGAKEANIQPRSVAIVMITLAVLHQNYSDMADLWKLIACKANAYVEREVGKLLEYGWMEAEATRLLRECRAKEVSNDQASMRCGQEKDGKHDVGKEIVKQEEWTELDTAPFQ